MYLKNGLNLKQFFSHFCLFLSLILFSDLYLNRSIALIFIGIFISYIVWVFYQIITDGFFILLAKSNIEGQTHHVRYFIKPCDLKKSFREISPINGSGCSSRSLLFQKDKNEILYIDIVKFLTQNLFFKKVLILGGAGCSLAEYFINNKKSRKIDVIEYNSTMIGWAKKYFLKGDDNINLIFGDGLKFLNFVSSSYDLIIIDMFNDYKFNEGIIRESFIKDVKKNLGKNGSFIINLGFAVHFEEVVKKWQKFFPLNIYLSRANLIISNLKFTSFEFNSPHRFLFEMPQSSEKSK